MTFVYNIDDAVKELITQIDKLKERADDTLPACVKLLEYPYLASISKSMDFYFKPVYGNVLSIVNIDKSLSYALKQIDDELTLKKYEEIHTENIKLCAHNKAMRLKVKNMMALLGIRDTYSTYDYKTKRSANQTETKHRAGFIDDLNRCAKTDCGYGVKYKQVTDYITRLKNHAAMLKKNLEDAERKQVIEKKSTALLETLAYLKVKYNLPIDSTAHDIFNKMTGDDRILKLAGTIHSAVVSEMDGDVFEWYISLFSDTVSNEADAIIDEIETHTKDFYNIADMMEYANRLYSFCSGDISKDVMSLVDVTDGMCL